jgi:hypothetical protein
MYKWDRLAPVERNALVAEKVMGWQVHDTALGRFWYNTNDEFVHWNDAWKPSELISYAWQVIEKIKDQFEFVSLLYGTDGKWHCNLTRFHGFENHEHDDFDIEEFSADAATAPEAICIAALRTVGIDIVKI